MISGDRIILRKVKDSDATAIVENVNDKEVTRYLSTVPYPYTMKDARFFIEKLCKKKNSKHFAIELKETGKLIGVVSLSKINRKHKKAVIGYWIGKKHWNKGIGTEALNLILGFGFRKLKLNRIYGKVMVPNIASAKLLEKAGFRHEGTLRKDVFIRGKWMDYKVYGLLKEDY